MGAQLKGRALCVCVCVSTAVRCRACPPSFIHPFCYNIYISEDTLQRLSPPHVCETEHYLPDTSEDTHTHNLHVQVFNFTEKIATKKPEHKKSLGYKINHLLV